MLLDIAGYKYSVEHTLRGDSALRRAEELYLFENRSGWGTKLKVQML